jgi:hypothetical protein
VCDAELPQPVVAVVDPGVCEVVPPHELLRLADPELPPYEPEREPP